MELFPADSRKEQPRNGSGVNDRETVRKQYSTAEKLNTRISIHAKYSTNKQGFGNWIADQSKQTVQHLRERKADPDRA